MGWPAVDAEKVKNEPICVIGAGPAGLITAHVLLQDGFRDVQVLCRDSTVGGVWARGRVYPDMHLNNVYGEMRFSSLSMESPSDEDPATTPDKRLRGIDASKYFERYHDKFLVRNGKSVVRFNTEVARIQRGPDGRGWLLDTRTKDPTTGEKEESTLSFPRIVVCTGGTSAAKVPAGLTPGDATKSGFSGPVLHSSESWAGIEAIKESAREAPGKPVVVIGGGKSAQDMSAYLANEGIPVTVVCNKLDMFLSSRAPLPMDLRQSRMVTVLSPRVDIDTRLEKFLHNTWAGSKFVRWFWKYLEQESYTTYEIPEDSPLRDTHSLFWDTRYGDQGVRRDDSFPALASQGKITLRTKVHVSRYYEGGVELGTGEKLEAAAVILATGYRSSWDGMFDDNLAAEIGLTQVVRTEDLKPFTWDYKSLRNPPEDKESPNTSIVAPGLYKGLIPAKSIERRDIAMTGAIGSANIGYTYEVSAHWISAYFLGEKMRLPKSTEGAVQSTVRNLAWMKTRFPSSKAWENASQISALPQLSWIQAMDDLLDDMYLPSRRSGGNWLNWVFRPVQSEELLTLSDERRAKRGEAKS
ncbi:hypothetical protein NMY22_g9712 [Coprinellus aureogranulatus]|nr:hypothetical protein NMY22_g9712 [Coprinellus aureogranulatus]